MEDEPLEVDNQGAGEGANCQCPHGLPGLAAVGTEPGVVGT